MKSDNTGSEQWKSLEDLFGKSMRLGDQVYHTRESKSAPCLQTPDHNNLAHEGIFVRDYGTFVTPFALGLVTGTGMGTGMGMGSNDAVGASTTTQATSASSPDTLPPSKPASSADLSSGIPSREPSGSSLASGELLTKEDLQQVSHLRNTIVKWAEESDSEDDEGLEMKITVREGRGRKTHR